MKEKKKGPGFVVKDKRLFAESDEPRPQEEVKASTAEEAMDYLRSYVPSEPLTKWFNVPDKETGNMH